MKLLYYLSIVLCAMLWGSESKETVFVNQYSMCRAKATCEKCLQLPQCGWCESWLEGPKCFPLILKDTLKNECNDLFVYEKLDLSLESNAECICSRNNMPEDCVAPGAAHPCLGRGSCSCGRCVCDQVKDDNGTVIPNKIISGKYCECDNYSCEGIVGKDCSEGPYCLPVESAEALDADSRR